jgi:hypothetical protein
MILGLFLVISLPLSLSPFACARGRLSLFAERFSPADSVRRVLVLVPSAGAFRSRFAGEPEPVRQRESD